MACSLFDVVVPCGRRHGRFEPIDVGIEVVREGLPSGYAHRSSDACTLLQEEHSGPRGTVLAAGREANVRQVALFEAAFEAELRDAGIAYVGGSNLQNGAIREFFGRNTGHPLDHVGAGRAARDDARLGLLVEWSFRQEEVAAERGQRSEEHTSELQSQSNLV